MQIYHYSKLRKYASVIHSNHVKAILSPLQIIEDGVFSNVKKNLLFKFSNAIISLSNRNFVSSEIHLSTKIVGFSCEYTIPNFVETNCLKVINLMFNKSFNPKKEVIYFNFMHCFNNTFDFSWIVQAEYAFYKFLINKNAFYFRTEFASSPAIASAKEKKNFFMANTDQSFFISKKKVNYATKMHKWNKTYIKARKNNIDVYPYVIKQQLNKKLFTLLPFSRNYTFKKVSINFKLSFFSFRISKENTNKSNTKQVVKKKQTLTPFEKRESTFINKNSLETNYFLQVQSFNYPTYSNERSLNVSYNYKKKDLTHLISIRTGFSTSVYFINAFAYTRFAFDFQRKQQSNYFSKIISSTFAKKIVSSSNVAAKVFKKKQKNSARFLYAINKERLSRYRYIGVFIQDLIRLGFISFYCKYSQLLVGFFAFTLSKLPRNRKETKFLRFLIKLVKVFAAQRKEVTGIRVRFQGRVNRWRRTKHILAQKGVLPLHTYRTRFSYGWAQSITRKGTFGRHLWIAYDPNFIRSYKNTFYYFIQNRL